MNYSEERILAEARYIIEKDATVRSAAKKFNRSKSAVHLDMTKRLEFICPVTYSTIKGILNFHKEVRALRGGAATKSKWEKIRDKPVELFESCTESKEDMFDRIDKLLEI